MTQSFYADRYDPNDPDFDASKVYILPIDNFNAIELIQPRYATDEEEYMLVEWGYAKPEYDQTTFEHVGTYRLRSPRTGKTHPATHIVAEEVPLVSEE